MKSDETYEIYVHVPFCARKCEYCDFVSSVADGVTINRYFDMLIQELKQKSESLGRVRIDSVFFGGGTPSLVPGDKIAKVLDVIRNCFLLTDDAEITLEMNPNSADSNKLSIYKAAGVNRISIGLQSANDVELKKLTRLHNYSEFLKAYADAREAGFCNINIDLMSAIPGQTLKSYEETLRKVTALSPEHISAYSLILEEGTPFYEKYKDGHDLPCEDTEREMYYLTKEILKECGYERYEISNYSKPGYECRHNVGYWIRKPYIGIGIAAASLIGLTRYQKHSDLKRYLRGDFSEEETVLSKNDEMEEFMFLGLRMTRGISVSAFREQFGTDIYNVYGKQIEKLEKEGLLVAGEQIFLTDRGLDVANYCMTEFIL